MAEQRQLGVSPLMQRSQYDVVTRHQTQSTLNVGVGSPPILVPNSARLCYTLSLPNSQALIAFPEGMESGKL